MPLPASGTTPERQTIVIAGAGIGGLTAALALARAGYRVVIAERTAELSEAGAGIQIAPNAGRVLASLGLDDAIGARAIEPQAIDVRRWHDGATLASIAGSAFRERYDFPYRVLHRADLQSILLAAAMRDPAIDIELDATLADRLTTDDGLLARIRRPSGGEVVPAVAVIGADGVWSETRRAIGGRSMPAATGRTAWRAVIAADDVRDLVTLDRVGLWLGPGGHLVHYPVAGGSAVNVVAIVREDWDKRGWSGLGSRDEIVARFVGWAREAQSLIDAGLSWHKHAILTVDSRGPWVEGRTALLGDAAHAMVPFLAQGAAMAIEDAAVLAACLYGGADIAEGLRDYAAIRKTRVRRVALASDDAGRHYHDSGAMAFARDTALRIAGERLILNRNDWIYRWRHALPGA